MRIKQKCIDYFLYLWLPSQAYIFPSLDSFLGNSRFSWGLLFYMNQWNAASTYPVRLERL
ncbi:MAG: hypothetical protein AAF518_06800 [Spirochaetota bacterium]